MCTRITGKSFSKEVVAQISVIEVSLVPDEIVSERRMRKHIQPRRVRDGHLDIRRLQRMRYNFTRLGSDYGDTVAEILTRGNFYLKFYFGERSIDVEERFVGHQSAENVLMDEMKQVIG